MPFPFVSRERLTERDATIVELKAKIVELEADRKHWVNQFGWRATGIAPYPELLPKHPVFPHPSLEPKAEGMNQEVPTGLEAARKKAGTSNPRAMMTVMQRQKDTEFGVMTGAITPTEPTPRPIPPSQAEVAKTIFQDIQDAASKGA